jgi:hypothetical protein
MESIKNQRIASDGSTEIIMSKLTISNAQKAIVSKSVYKMTNASSRINILDKEIRKIKNAISEDPKTLKLKELKRQRKLINNVHNESATAYNAVLEMALSDIPGSNILEKIDKLGV